MSTITLASSIPASWYVDESIYETERQKIFSKSWLYAADASEIQQVGDYICCEMAGFSIFLFVIKIKK